MNHTLLIVSALAAGLVAVAPVHAETAIEDEGIPRLPEIIETRQASTEAALLSLTVGGSAGMTYIDNIFRSPTNEESDLVAVFAPGFAIRSDFDDHEFKFAAKVEKGRYISNSENDYLDFDARTEGRYHLNDTVSLIGSGRWRFDHVEVGAFVDTPENIAAEPTDYRNGELSAGVEADNGIWYGLADLRGEFYNYDNAKRRNGTQIINDDRDRYEVYATLRAGAYANADTLIYLQGVYNQRNYRKMVDTTAIMERDSDGIYAALGVAYGDRDADDNWIDINAGLASQSYDNAFLPDIDTLGLQAESEWLIAPQLELSIDASRSIEENTLAGASGYVRSRLKIGLEYDVNELWTIGAEGRYTRNDFEINPASGRTGRKDDVYDSSLYVQYNIFDNYYVGLEYLHVDRDSTDSTVEYTQNAVLARVGLKY